jgi:hypothetical protein
MVGILFERVPDDTIYSFAAKMLEGRAAASGLTNSVLCTSLITAAARYESQILSIIWIGSVYSYVPSDVLHPRKRLGQMVGSNEWTCSTNLWSL